MSSFKRIAAGASALVLASGAALAGAGIAGAQGSSEIAADLDLAATALGGPVTVAGNAEGGPTVTYTNDSEVAENCAGFTLPYSTIADNDDINPNLPDDADILESLALVQAIEAAGGVSLLTVDEDGAPLAYADPNPAPEANGDIVAMIAGAIFGNFSAFANVAPGAPVVWEAPTPTTPAAAAVICIPEEEGGEMAINFGIDPQVVADQINGRIPGGSIEVVSPGMISAGSVESGAMVLGSLGEAGSGDDAEEPPVEEPAE